MLIFKTKNIISKFQREFLDFYTEKYKTHKIFVEIPLIDYFWLKRKYEPDLPKLMKKRCLNLRFDVYDSTTDIVYEVQGEQHNSFIHYFHKDIGSFDRQKTNDYLKKYVCDWFGTKLVEVKDKKFKEVCHV